MKTFLTVFLCLFCGLNVFGQAEQNESNEKIAVEEISLARGDGSGKAGEATNVFTTTDIPIHCFVQLASTKSVLVKMNLVAVKAEGLSPETKVVTVSFKTNGQGNQVNFNASPEKIWASGAYRVDIFLDSKLAKSLEFEIKKSPKDMSKEKQSKPKSAPPSKAKRKSRKT